MSKFLCTLVFIMFGIYGVAECIGSDEEKLDWRNDESIARLNWVDIASKLILQIFHRLM